MADITRMITVKHALPAKDNLSQNPGVNEKPFRHGISPARPNKMPPI